MLLVGNPVHLENEEQLANQYMGLHYKVTAELNSKIDRNASFYGATSKEMMLAASGCQFLADQDVTVDKMQDQFAHHLEGTIGLKEKAYVASLVTETL